MKWVEILQAFIFSLKHKKGVTNKVVDALSHRVLTLSHIQLESVGIEALKTIYEHGEDFGEIYTSCINLDDKYNVEFSDFLLQERLLFKGVQLCIPRCSMRLNIIKEKYNGAMARHFGLDKTLELVRRHYFWPKM